VEPGKLADLIIVDGDPLADISTLHKIVTVVQSGRVVHNVD
jgi:imidazolonepropionase-like amidohydrolase